MLTLSPSPEATTFLNVMSTKVMAYEEFEEGLDQEEFLELCNFPF
jgi:hypothetical protein